MEAILLTPEQATQLAAANGDSSRRLEPRELADGRLILNADILDDPVFGDATGPWWPIISAATPVTLTEEDFAESE